MALLCRIKQAKLIPFSRHFKRSYFQIPTPSFSNHESSKGFADCSYNYVFRSKKLSVFPTPVAAFGSNVRFFAAPVEFLKKVEVKEPRKVRLNEQIKAEIVRIVTDEGHEVVSRREALERAKRLELDLVEVDRNAKPPVCKIMDYNKERYKKKRKEKEAKIKSQGSLKRGDCKEVKFSAKTELKDLQIKADMGRRLLERGYRVKFMALSSEEQDLTGMLSQLSAMIEDVAFVEIGPKVERKQAYFIVRHVKFGPSKKGVKKASQIVGATSSQTQGAATPADQEGETCSEDSDMDNDDVVDAPPQDEEDTAWSVSDSKHDLDEIFDLNSDVMGTGSPKAGGFSQSRLPNLRTPTPDVGPSLPETENRYAKNTKNNASPAGNSTRCLNGKQPQPNSSVRPTGDPRLAGNEAFASRSSWLPQNETQPHGGNRQFEPRNNFSAPHGRSQPAAGIGRSSQSTGFGVFSAPKKDASVKHESGVEDKQGSSGSPFNVRRNVGPGTPATAKSNGSQGSGAGDGGKFGIFSRESSSSTPGRNFHSK